MTVNDLMDRYSVSINIRYDYESYEVLVWDNNPKFGLSVTSVPLNLEYRINSHDYITLPEDKDIYEYLKPIVIKVLGEYKNKFLSDKSFIINQLKNNNMSVSKIKIVDILVTLKSINTINNFHLYQNFHYKTEIEGKAHYELNTDDLISERL